MIVTRPDARILIVDDQPRNLDALEAMLAPIDCTVVRAESPDEALLKLLKGEFAAIILDIRMPGMSGIELATLIKARRRTQHVPILFLTAHLTNDEEVLKGYHVGAVDYLSKPINADVLRSKVAVFVDTFRKTLALAELNDKLEREVSERQKAQADLEVANRNLERRVDERTAALVRAHRGVRENEERLRMAMEVAQLAAWEWNLLTGEMTWSTDPEALFGLAPGAMGADMRLLRVVHPEDRGRLEASVTRAIETGIYEAEYRVLNGDGRELWITERGRVTEEDPERMVGIARDVTADRQAAQERERLLRLEAAARAEAERQSRLKDEFLATLSHELRTPMNAVLGWLSILESGKPIRDLQGALGVIRRNAQLQARLIDDLLDMNRLMSGNFAIEIGPVEVGTLVHTTLQTLQPLAREKEVRLNAEVCGDCGMIMADQRRLQQVLWNIVHNAVKFTSRGGRVELRVSRLQDSLEFVIEDNGKGITPAFLPHVFERFRQEDETPTREFFGLGLGLAIAKQLVDLHGGTISADSAGEGQGATFAIRLPAAAAVAARPGGGAVTLSA
ncbi:MAG: response regulator [Acidobacteria bacterium]|nr:response regulator [Acidobacteriota bacterium]